MKPKPNLPRQTAVVALDGRGKSGIVVVRIETVTDTGRRDRNHVHGVSVPDGKVVNEFLGN